MTHHLLLTAWAFPPARTSGVYRAAGLANAFCAAGWDVTVLCGPAELFASNGVVDRTLLDTVDSRVIVREVPLEHFELSSDLRQWSRLRARQPELWAKLRLRRDFRHFPEAWYGSWAPALRRTAEQVHRERPVTLSLGTAAPSVDFVPGEHLNRIASVPYLMDFRDAWTFDVFTGGPARWLSPEIAQREKQLLRKAHQVWFVNDTIRGWHADAYPGLGERMRTVRNGFDLPAGVRSTADLGAPLRATSEGPLTFGYIGTISFGSFPFRELIDGWRDAVPSLPDGSRLVLRGHLGRTGEGHRQVLDLLDECRDVGISYEGPVPRSAVWDVYRGFDALVLALSSGPGVTSGKVYEYAATGLPIVSVHSPDNPVGEILGGFRSWHPARSLARQDVAQAFEAAAAQIRTLTKADRAAAIEAAGRWERSQQLEAAVADLTDWADGDRG